MEGRGDDATTGKDSEMGGRFRFYRKLKLCPAAEGYSTLGSPK